MEKSGLLGSNPFYCELRTSFHSLWFGLRLCVCISVMTAAAPTHSGWGLSSGMKCMIQIPCSIRALRVGLSGTAAT